VAEAALLVGLIQAPSLYTPTTHLDRATARRAVVLRQMVAAGFLDAPSSTRLAASPVVLVDGFGQERSGQYFKNHITRMLIDEVGWERLSQGGLRVFATIDTATQIAAERAVVRGLDRAEQLRGFKHLKRGDPRTIHAGSSPTYLQGALVAIDPTSGEVRAMTGGRDFGESQYNRAIQMERQPGSAFKPIVYAAAIESGYTPATLVTDLDAPMQLPDGAWLPEDGHSTSSSMTLRTALRTSSNRAAVQVLRAVGIPAAVNYAHRLGLEAPPVPSLVLGTGDVSVLSMASAYGAFANGGYLRQPVFIRRVEDAEGHVLFSAKPKAVPVISEDTAFLMAQMLGDVVNSGTGFRAREAGFQFAAGGKTGTTSEYRDAWFIGFTPALVTSVWVGFDQPQTIMQGGYASELAVPIWARFMKDAAGTTDAGWVKRPADIVSIEICRLSGALATEGCRRATALNDRGEMTGRSYLGVEFFQSGTEPVDECPIHGEGSFSGARRSIIGSASFPDRPVDAVVPPIAPLGLLREMPGIVKVTAPPHPKPAGRSGGGGL
jgi:penicillin-binding protein 1A